MEPTNEFDSKYRYILVAARRARQLQGGASKLVETDSSKACRIAQDELDAGKVSYIVTEPETAVEAAPAESSEE